jgi:hypothetical protein
MFVVWSANVQSVPNPLRQSALLKDCLSPSHKKHSQEISIMSKGRHSARPLLEQLESRALPSLLAAYSFDQGAGTTLSDVSGNGNNGTISDAVWTKLGKYGGALQFNGASDSFVSIPDVAALHLAKGMTLEAWVDPSSLSNSGGNWCAVVSKEHVNSSNDISYALYAAQGTGKGPASHILINSTDVGASTSTKLALNTWTFLSSTYDGTTLRMYVNGTQVGTKAISGSIFVTTDPLKIGGDWSLEMFTGLIDNVRIYNTALTQAAIQIDMTTPVAPADTQPPTVSLTNPTSGAMVSGTITISATATDNVAVQGVQFALDGTNLGSQVKASPYQITWNSAGVANGPHTISATATDTSGNTSSTSVTVTVQNVMVAPTVTITSPANNSNWAGTISLAATASSGVGIANVQFAVDGANVGSTLTAAPYQVAWDSTTVADGSHTILATATDTSGATASSSITLNIFNRGTFGPVINTPSNPVTGDPVVPMNMVLLDNGKILFWDGGPNCLGAVSPTVWDPVAGTFTAVPLENQTEVRDIFCSGQTVLADGRVIVAGGHECVNPAYVGTAIANVFDPSTNQWAFLPNMNDRRWYPTATTLPDGRALVTAGADTSVTNYDPIPEVYDPVANTWTKLTGANRTIPDYPFMFVLPDGRVLTAGSDEAKMATSVIDVATQTWTTVDSTILDAGSAVQYLPGKIMKAGSSYLSAPADNGGSVPSAATTYVLDMNASSPAWQQTASMANARTHVNLTILPDDTVLATGGSSDIGGVNPANAVYQAELWSPTTKTWTTMASEQVPRLYHSTALLLPDGRVAVAGGGHNYFNNIAYPNAEIYSPAYLFKGARPTVTSVPSTLAYGTSFFVGTPDGATISSVALIHNGAVTHSFNMDQSFVPLSFTQTTGGLMVQAPANSALAVPGDYMLFLVNSKGVPSIAPMVRLPVPAPDTQPPTAPAGLVATGGTGSVTLTWNASTDNVGVTQYNIYRSTTSGFAPTAANKVGTSTSTSYTDTVSAAGTYYYLVTAQDAAGNVSSPSNQATAVVGAPSNLVASYSFSEGAGTTTADSSGYNNNGTITNATWTAAGKNGNALHFNGQSNSYVTIPASSSLNLTSAVTVEAWVNPSTLNSMDQGWCAAVAKEHQNSGNDICYSLYAAQGTGTGPAFHVLIGGTDYAAGASSVLPLNTWTFLAGTYNGNTLTVYVNGVLTGNKSVIGSIFSTSDPLRIGGDWSGEMFTGIIDDVRVYNTAQTQTQIQSDMNQSVRTSNLALATQSVILSPVVVPAPSPPTSAPTGRPRWTHILIGDQASSMASKIVHSLFKTSGVKGVIHPDSVNWFDLDDPFRSLDWGQS